MKPSTDRTAQQIRYNQSRLLGVKITFPFNQEDLDRIRTIPGRKYHTELKCWSAPLHINTLRLLKEWGFVLDTELTKHLNKPPALKNIEIPGLKGILCPFQREGIAFIENKNGRCLIADEMGLGKTIQALAWLQLHPELRPVVIVVPASLKLNWEKEIFAWMDKHRVQILYGTKADMNITGDIIIMNYDILSAWLDPLRQIKPQVLIADECHLFKNNKAQRTKAVKQLGKHIPHIICLSGTPIINRPIEIFNAIKLIDPTVVKSYWQYGHRYCGARHNGFGWDFNGATNTEELHQILTNSIMIRRLKEDVLPELPEKTHCFIPIELENKAEYKFAERNFILWLNDLKGAEAAERASNAQALAEVEALKQLAVKGKLRLCIEWIRNVLITENKLVVFATHKFVIAALMEEFGKIAVKIDGSVSAANRQKAVDKFQTNSEVRLFVGNLKAAGVGITLTAASKVAILEWPWTPGELAQAPDRLHRIGQKNKVFVYYLMANGTIEEKIALLLDKKRKVLDAVLDGKELDQTSLLTELMNEYK